jgi:hypothetical protein
MQTSYRINSQTLTAGAVPSRQHGKALIESIILDLSTQNNRGFLNALFETAWAISIFTAESLKRTSLPLTPAAEGLLSDIADSMFVNSECKLPKLLSVFMPDIACLREFSSCT